MTFIFKLYFDNFVSLTAYANICHLSQADGRDSKAGLGNKVTSKSSNPNMAYKDAVKQTLWQRYQNDD